MEVTESPPTFQAPPMNYQKRVGTSGAEGHFYETKVIALVMLRLLHDERVADFCLATNMEGMGAFDDICVKVSLVGRDRPLALFIQLKHKIHDDASLTIHGSSTDLVKYVDSFVTINNKITSQKDRDYFFDKSISKADSLFILYTNSEFKVTNSALQTKDLLKRFVSSYDSFINELLGAEDSNGRALRLPEQVVRDFSKSKQKEDLAVLAEQFATYLCDKTKLAHIMNDEYLRQYHVVLARLVAHVGDIQIDGCRELTFRDEFFISQDEPVSLFRRMLYKQIFKKHPKTMRQTEGADSTATEEKVDDQIASFLSHGSAAALSSLITAHVVSYKDGTLHFLVDRPDSDMKKLNRMKVPPETVAEAYLRKLKLNVPIGFGNVDMVVSGGPKNVERRLNHLVKGIFGMCQRYEQVESLKVVTIDETVDGNLLTHSGGLASCVGNLLTWDESTDTLMVTDRFTPHQSNAETLFTKLKEKIEQPNNGTVHLSDYRFKVQTNKLPKLRFDCTDTVRGFISKLVIYDKQNNQSKVERLLKDEIQNLLYKRAHHNALQCHSVFLHYHDEVVSWWMRSSGTYLKKASNLYELAINSIKAEPQISALHTTFHVNNSRFYEYRFDETTPKWSALAQLPAHIAIVTDTVTLTAMKAIQCLRKLRAINKYAVFDIKSVANLSAAEFCSLQAELRKTEKVIIIVWRVPDSDSMSHSTLQQLAQATKQIVIVTSDVLMEKVYEYFPHIKVFRDETQNFTSMTAESQKELIKNCRVIFQGVALNFELLMDDGSLSFMKGVVLDKLTRHERISLGTTLGDPRYEEIKHLYIDRKVNCVSEKPTGKRIEPCLVRTFHDIADEAVLLTAPPGMGKSTLLTRLSINTKERDPTLWIVRVNFIDHSEQFEKWCKKKTHRVSAVEALEFLCRVVIRDERMSFSVQLTNNEASLVNCAADGLITFELNMFLHCYNMQRLMYVLDGFDEICPHYKDKVVDFLIVVKTRLKKNKMWVTSRPYSDILPDLQRALGRGFQMEHLSYREQESLLKSFWREKSIYAKLYKQLERLETFIENVSQSISEVHEWVQFIYYNFVDVMRHVLCQSRHADIEGYLDHFRGRPVEDTMSGIPLILYFMADYFVHVVDSDEECIKSKLIINLHDIYETVVKNKLGKILLQDKSNMDLSNPYTRFFFEKALEDCISVYKKLGANALFQDSIFKNLRFKEFEDMTPLDNVELYEELNKIKIGKDKTGLISHVDDVAVFIHRSFTEYFAAEYACDILKSRKYKKHIKVLWYSALTCLANEGVRDWIEKKKQDKRYENVFKEIEEPPPLYTNMYRNYLDLDRWSESQRIRILASSVDDYDNLSFTTFSEVFTFSYWERLGAATREKLKACFRNYTINKMKVHLRIHFIDKALFRLIDNNFYIEYYLAPNIEAVSYINDICLKIEIVGQEGGVPVCVRLEHKDADDAINFNYSGFETNQKIASRADDTCTSHMYLMYYSNEFRMGLYSKHEPEFLRAFDTFMAITNTVRCRLQHSEQNVQEFANFMFKKELLLFAENFASILSQSVSNSYLMRYFGYVERYRYRDILEQKHDLNNPDWHILIFRDDFLDTEDTHTTQLRNYLIEEILNYPVTNLSTRIPPDELMTSFWSAPSTDTLTPLIGAYIVYYKDSELKFAISRPPDDVERLKRVDIPQSAIDDALGAVRTAVIEYLRSLRLRVPVNIHDDLMVSGRLMRIVGIYVDAILELCELHVRTDLYKVVTFDNSRHSKFLRSDKRFIDALGSVLTFDERSDMLKFSKAHQIPAGQKTTKLLLEKLSDKKNDLHEYRFRFKYNKLSELHADLSVRAREFLDKLVIYGKQGSHYRLENIFREGNILKKQNLHFTTKPQLILLHYHSETVKWWLSTSANLSSMSQEGDAHRTAMRDLYRRVAYNVTTEPLMSELHTIFHMTYLKYYDNSYYKRNSKWKEVLAIPCRTLIETDAAALAVIEMVHFLRSNDSVHNFTILDLNYVFNTSSGSKDRRSLCAELRYTDKVLIVVWHTPQTADDSERLDEIAEAIEDKNIIVVTNNESGEKIRVLSTNRVFNYKTEL